MILQEAAVPALPTWLDRFLGFFSLAAPSDRADRPWELPEDFQPLVDISREALGARDLADLSARMDGSVMRLWGLPLPSPPLGRLIENLDGLPRDVAPESGVARAIGLNAARKVLRGLHELVPTLRILVAADADVERRELLLRALRVRPWSLHEGQVVPGELVESAIVQCRGLLACGALLASCADARRPEPWLANALADAYVASVRETARLTASAGYDVGAPPTEALIDLRRLFLEAERADAAFLARFEADVRAGRVGVPEDE
jgi:hypothetical protein